VWEVANHLLNHWAEAAFQGSLFQLSWLKSDHIINFQKLILAAQIYILFATSSFYNKQIKNLDLIQYVQYMGWVGVTSHLQSCWEESDFWDSCIHGQALLKEPQFTDAILEFGTVCPITLLCQYWVKWCYWLFGVVHFCFFVQWLSYSNGQLDTKLNSQDIPKAALIYQSSITS